ncbi:MAG: hypothetical protein K0Q72_4233, partial [Armatimonadetes bacterium]|nr:hypothetical protein [Armatimonadota bacterium]
IPTNPVILSNLPEPLYRNGVNSISVPICA